MGLGLTWGAWAEARQDRDAIEGDPVLRAGSRIYEMRCASCHGARGEGVAEEYDRELTGDRSVAQLGRYIAKAMPPDEPETCEGEDAEAVAAYIHHAFYSPLARERNRPARVELSRLTARQYANAVADLVGSFRGPGEALGEERGLTGEYYKSRRRRGGDRAWERLDREIRFDFGEEGPREGDEALPGEEFSIVWRGSVIAGETGDHEFVLNTENGARLWVNDQNAPLIDAWVRSGSEAPRATIRLLGGRAYPLRLEMFKSKEAKEKRASIALEWIPPGGARTPVPVPSRALRPGRAPETFVAVSPFPPDDRSAGYERATSISREWDRATTEGALETAAYAASRIRELAGVREGMGDEERAGRLREFAARFAERAFRRPLSEEDRRNFVDRWFEGAEPETGLRRSMLLTLKSPRFLYRELTVGDGDGYDTASRLAFTLWDSIPDRELTEAARAGRLGDREEVRRQAERMLADPRARAKQTEFLRQWLRMDHMGDISKDREIFPGFDELVAADARASLELFLEGALSGESADFRRLLLADEVPLNGRLARFLGVEGERGDWSDTEFAWVSLAKEGRAGVLTHPYPMMGFAYHGSSSPIHRGVFVARSVLGRTLRPPPEAVAPLAPDLHPDLTTRERVALQTSPRACMSCHALINPLGFALERFDGAGRLRGEEKGKGIDASGWYQTADGSEVRFDGARELAEMLAGSEEVHGAFAEQMFQYLVKQPILAYGADTRERLREAFAASGFDIRRLALEIGVIAAFPGGGAGGVAGRGGDAGGVSAGGGGGD